MMYISFAAKKFKLLFCRHMKDQKIKEIKFILQILMKTIYVT